MSETGRKSNARSDALLGNDKITGAHLSNSASSGPSDGFNGTPDPNDMEWYHGNTGSGGELRGKASRSINVTDGSSSHAQTKSAAARLSRSVDLQGGMDPESISEGSNSGVDIGSAFENGYHFPPGKKNAKEMIVSSLKAFWLFFATPSGFLITIYALNIVAWGGMLFLLLINAAPAMCVPDCRNVDSPRLRWIEIDSQILNALFCVTGLGLIPWRFRDLYYLLIFRIRKSQRALRRLAGINRNWFRLQGSENLPLDIGPANVVNESSRLPENTVPFPPGKISNPPLTGIRASPTSMWKLDFFIWSMVWNSLFQIALCVFMWGFNRFNRPSWSTGLFVTLACGIACVGGLVVFREGSRVKSIEGVPVSEEDMERLKRDAESDIIHYNNIKDKIPKGEKNRQRQASQSGKVREGGKEGI